ncbi:hypothetical protein PSN45_001193 [Yamadazyma tenuis]|uniref:uncharacterized protein n=1 Tax=Candida tenuis TaxID=2315449 RepID=UPI0027A8A218|nr:hypothetical protein PSN45_001193 [Yamadazyma tenuis]
MADVNAPTGEDHDQTSPSSISSHPPLPTVEDSPDTDKNNPRAKLSNSDIKLILYLIVTIKPFKYTGDRTLSQTKKWDIIQRKFSRRRMSQSPPPFIPTVRTLQRQLSSAIKKARERRKTTPINLNADPVFKSVSHASSLADLEMATLELFELSETLKNGRIANSVLLEYSSVSKVDESDDDQLGSPPSGAPAPAPLVLPPINASSPRYQPAPLVTTLPVPLSLVQESDDILANLNSTRESIKNLLAETGTSTSVKTILELVTSLVKQNTLLQQVSTSKMESLIETNNRLIELNRKFQLEQSALNRTLMNEVLASLKSNPSVAQETIDLFNSLK